MGEPRERADSAGRVTLGSGVILRSDGVIATNYHVIEGVAQARVKLRNGDIYDDVSVLDTDERKDIAILKIKATGLQALEVADSDAVRVGETVYAIGAPRGLEGSLAGGLVSSVRPIDEIEPSLTGFRVIQFTAPISPGSSGGPLVNASGKLIGIVTAFLTNSQNINVAVPAKPI
jgi:serine protease Do